MLNVNYDILKKILDESSSKTEVLTKLGLNINGGNFKTLRKLLKEYDLKFDGARTSREEYNKNKKHCKHCGKEIDFEHKLNDFCSSSCAAKYNNSGRKHSEETKKKISNTLTKKEKMQEHKHCVVCGKELTGGKRKYCSKACKAKMYSHTRYHTKYSQKKDKTGMEIKYEYIKKLGGCCSICGYDRNISALTFHHLRDKNFTLDSRTFERCPKELLEEEIEKCILVCSNCHHEIHHPQYNKEVLDKK